MCESMCVCVYVYIYIYKYIYIYFDLFSLLTPSFQPASPVSTGRLSHFIRRLQSAPVRVLGGVVARARAHGEHSSLTHAAARFDKIKAVRCSSNQGHGSFRYALFCSAAAAAAAAAAACISTRAEEWARTSCKHRRAFVHISLSQAAATTLRGGGAGGSSLKNLHAMVVGVSHDDAPVAVDGNATTRVGEFSVA